MRLINATAKSIFSIWEQNSFSQRLTRNNARVVLWSRFLLTFALVHAICPATAVRWIERKKISAQEMEGSNSTWRDSLSSS